MNAVQEVQQLGQSIWYDNIRRGLIKSGELQELIDLGVSGLTSNPTIFEKAIAGSTDYDKELAAPSGDGTSVDAIYEALVVGDIRAASDLLRPVYERTGGADGYASLEVSPSLAHDTDGTVAEARRLFDALDRLNIMIKIPATAEGIPAIRRVVAQGISVNVTLIFSLEVYRQVAEAYIAGLEDLIQDGGEVGNVASVASFFVSRVDATVDALLEARIREGDADLRSLLGKAATSNAKLAYGLFKEIFGGERFAALRARGARVQRPLWASTGTKNPSYSDVLYVESLVGPDTVNTVPPATLTAFLDHGSAQATLELDEDKARETIEALQAAEISMERVTAKLLSDGLEAFADSFDNLMANIQEKRARLLAHDDVHPGASLGEYLPDVETALADLQERDVTRRIWNKDHTVWKPDPVEISNRLGWLTVSDQMSEGIPALIALADEIKTAGYRHVVLLGMGGSSLGPEVLKQTFESAAGYPELIVLDSTVPAWIRAVTEAIDPAYALFLVSSKSGSTVEPNTFYAHFRQLVEGAVGRGRAGEHFVAITDPGTPLEKMARDQKFRAVFSNPPDIGGRYSVLSYFGLVPAALTGIDITKLLYRADCMREGCASCVPVHDNPGAWLGAVMGTISRSGRDKLTLVTSPAISSFGLWAEQLIAESTGKEDKGIVPVAGEPLVTSQPYGADRVFIYLRLDGDNNAQTDAAVEGLQAAGQPVARLDLRDKYDLGAEFYRWEFATAVAGAILGIHPFDQPNVQRAKDMTETVLGQYEASGRLPDAEATSSLQELLSQPGPGDYLAIMAYLRQTPEVDRALELLRRRVQERYGIATTLGYGPRFLHSTGQLHKGGPRSGLFLQLDEAHDEDVPIPGKPYTFSVLANAQALGDLNALQAAGRRVAKVHLGSTAESSILTLASELG